MAFMEKKKTYRKKPNSEEIKEVSSDLEKSTKTEIKDAHATGIGALERSEETQIEGTGNSNWKKDNVVY